MGLLPDIKEGVLVSVEIPRLRKSTRRLSRKFEKLLDARLRRANRKRRREGRKAKALPFVRPKYKDYIKSKAWRDRKAAYYARHEKKCVVCGTDHRIGLHHLSYANLGREKDEDLVALCWLHHEAYHEQHGVKHTNSSTHEYIEEERQIVEFTEIARTL